MFHLDFVHCKTYHLCCSLQENLVFLTFKTDSIVTYFLQNLRNAINLSRNAINIHHEWAVLWTLKKIVVSRTAVRPTEAKQEHLSDKLRRKRLYTIGQLRWISCNLRDKSVTAPLYPLRVALAFQSLYLGCLYRFLLRQIFP